MVSSTPRRDGLTAARLVGLVGLLFAAAGECRHPARRRVPGQRPDRAVAELSRRRQGKRRRLRRRLVEPAPGRRPLRRSSFVASTPPATPLDTELQVNSFTADIQDYPAVATQSGGAFVVVWESQQDGDGYGVFGQRFSSSGAKEGGEFQVNTLHHRLPDHLRRWRRTRTETSWSPGAAPIRMAPGAASSAAASTARACRRPPSSRSTPTPRACSSTTRWP